jgi:putative sterol carrier protein
MTDIVAAAVRALNDRMDGQGLPGTVKFVIEGEGSVLIDGEGATAADGPADCTMTASKDTFRGILDGDINPTMAFMSGKLKIDGDMGLAMKLGTILA